MGSWGPMAQLLSMVFLGMAMEGVDTIQPPPPSPSRPVGAGLDPACFGRIISAGWDAPSVPLPRIGYLCLRMAIGTTVGASCGDNQTIAGCKLWWGTRDEGLGMSCGGQRGGHRRRAGQRKATISGAPE